MPTLGEELLDLCKQATKEVILVSPFIKVNTLKRILNSIPEQTTSIKCVTRWRPEEIAAGVSDIEIFDLIQERLGAKLFIHPFLHAKFFRIDSKCFIGSANLTQRALGWAMPSNLEFMLHASSGDPRIQLFEQNLFMTTFEATQEIKDETISILDSIQKEGNVSDKFLMAGDLADDNDTYNSSYWLPLCTRPELLYGIYSGKDADRIVKWTFESGQRDLQFLGIPSGFSSSAFNKFVAASIQQAPVIQHIYEMAKNTITPEVGVGIILSFEKQYCTYSPEEHWKTIKAWLLYFLPHIYRQPSGSNDLQRGTQIGEL